MSVFVGVAGFVVNDNNEVLLITEKWQRNLKFSWKLPGGVSDPGIIIDYNGHHVTVVRWLHYYEDRVM